MTCLRDNNQGADLLIGYLEGTLDQAQRSELDAHAASCGECRGLLAVQASLEGYTVPAVSVDFDARLYARIAAEPAKRWWQLPQAVSNLVSWRFAAPLVAAGALVLGLYVQQRPIAAPANDNKQASVDSREVLELEQALQDMDLLMPLGGKTNSI